MKRSRDIEIEIEIAEMATCLMLLSRVGETDRSSSRVFSCKTCNREFASFQALGGHRTSHKKARTAEGGEPPSPAKSKGHECSICGVEFAIGQALGGHMRRHRNDVVVVAEKTRPRVRDVCLDLNLGTREMDLSLRLGLVL